MNLHVVKADQDILTENQSFSFRIHWAQGRFLKKIKNTGGYKHIIWKDPRYFEPVKRLSWEVGGLIYFRRENDQVTGWVKDTAQAGGRWQNGSFLSDVCETAFQNDL